MAATPQSSREIPPVQPGSQSLHAPKEGHIQLPQSETEFLRAIRGYYESTASDYDHVHFEEAEHPFLREYFLKVVGASPVLDVGAGTGRVSEWLGSQVLALDLSADLLHKGVQQRRFTGGVVCADASSLPFADRSFPVVAAVNLLHHCFDPARVVEEMARVARQHVLITDSVGFLAHLKSRASALLNGAATNPNNVYYCKGDGYCTRAQLWRLVSILRKSGFRLRIFPMDLYGLRLKTNTRTARWLRLIPWQLAKSALVHAYRD